MPSRQVVPLRVAWRLPAFDRDRALKLRHLIFGDPRYPGPLRARFILWRDRRRAQILVGEAATLETLNEIVGVAALRDFEDDLAASQP